jgi:organic radical activating enzyme
MLPIHEQFYSFQGEGEHLGKAAYFIRTFGCPVHCPWCDSAGTWHPDYIPEKVDRMEIGELVESAAATHAEFVVVTGGEPTIHNLEPLVHALHAAGLRAHLETSGAFPIRGDFDWITLSPKRWKLPLSENLRKANEFKIIVDSPEAISEYVYALKGATRCDQPVWLNPEWTMHKDPAILDAITDWVKRHGAPYRAGWQMHKPYRADLLDPKSAKGAPLGGDLAKGY